MNTQKTKIMNDTRKQEVQLIVMIAFIVITVLGSLAANALGI